MCLMHFSIPNLGNYQTAAQYNPGQSAPRPARPLRQEGVGAAQPHAGQQVGHIHRSIPQSYFQVPTYVISSIQDLL